MNDARMPYKITGPAMVKILAPTPKTYPSVFASSAGDTTEFAKPVIGTIVPAPASFASFGYISSPVSSALKNIRVIDVAVDAVSSSSPVFLYKLRIN